MNKLYKNNHTLEYGCEIIVVLCHTLNATILSMTYDGQQAHIWINEKGEEWIISVNNGIIDAWEDN